MGQIDFKVGTPKAPSELRRLEEIAKPVQQTRIFIAEPFQYWQKFYRDEIGRVIGQSNIVIAVNYDQSKKILAYSPRFSTYIIEPKMPEGFGLAESIRQMEENSHTVLIVSSDDRLAKKAREVGFKHVVKKDYKNPASFIEELKKEIGL